MFSLDWFLTPAGIFITLGVLLLVAALVIFLVTKNKDKKEKEKSGVDNMANAALSAGPPVDPMGGVVQATQNPVIQPVDNTQMVQPAMDVQQPVIDPQNNIGVGMPDMGGVSPVVDNSGMTQQVEVPNVYSNDSIADLNAASQPQDVVTGSAEIPTVEGISMEVPQVELPDSINQAPNVDTQVAQPMTEVSNVYSTENITAPEVSSDTSSFATPVTQDGTIGVPTVDQAMPEIEGISMPVEQPTPAPEVSTSIYGGASPAAVPDFNQAPAQPQIYGGANPLENTQQVPIADITNNNMVQNNVVPETPIVQPSTVAAPVAPNEANVAAVTAVQTPTQDYSATVNNFQSVGGVNNAPAYSASNAQAQIPTQNNIGQ